MSPKGQESGRFAELFSPENLARQDAMSDAERIAAAAVVAPGAGRTALGSEYDHLFATEQPSIDVEAAAIRPQGNEELLPPARTSDRIGYWKRPTNEQVAAAAARKDGADLTTQFKYYS